MDGGAAIHANTMMFSGFVYEAIVDVPNLMLAKGVEAQALWAPYHWATNPVHFYTVPGLVLLPALLILWLRRAELSGHGRRRLRVALYGLLGTAVTTGIAVTQINDELYFGPPIGDPARVRFLAVTWFVVNALRIVSTATTTIGLAGLGHSLLLERETAHTADGRG
jgi:hypothetical protein